MANMTDVFNGLINSATSAGKAVWDAVPSMGELMNVDPQSANNFSLEQEGMVGYDNPEYQAGPIIQGISDEMDEYGQTNNPYGFPQAALDQSKANIPLAQSMVGEAAEGISEAIPAAVGATAEAIPKAFEATGEAFGNAVTQEIQPVYEAPKTVNPANKQEVFDMMEFENKTKAEHMGRLAKQKAADIEENGDEAQKKSLWQMVSDATKEVAQSGIELADGLPGAMKDGFDISYKAWMDLAPSTRMALVGTAATAFAYSKGWKKTAGDVAKGSAAMYSGMYGQETAAQGAVDVENAKRIGKMNDPKNDPNKWEKHDYERVNTHFSDLIANKYSGTLGFGADPQGQAKQANQMAAGYRQYLVVNNIPSDAFTPENYVELLLAQEREKARRQAATHTETSGATWLEE